MSVMKSVIHTGFILVTTVALLKSVLGRHWDVNDAHSSVLELRQVCLNDSRGILMFT